MPFEITNQPNSIIKLIITDTEKSKFVIEEMKELLTVLERLLLIKKPFAFYIYCQLDNTPSQLISMTKCLVNWMNKNHEGIAETLVGSSIIVKSTIIKNMFKTIFTIKKTIKPNLITTDYNKGEKFVNDVMNKYLQKA